MAHPATNLWLLQNAPPAVDNSGMNLRPSTLDRIAVSFADAVASGDYEAAEGWITTARYVERREADRRVVPAAGRVGLSGWAGLNRLRATR
jgi:hypothetical protein